MASMYLANKVNNVNDTPMTIPVKRVYVFGHHTKKMKEYLEYLQNHTDKKVSMHGAAFGANTYNTDEWRAAYGSLTSSLGMTLTDPPMFSPEHAGLVDDLQHEVKSEMKTYEMHCASIGMNQFALKRYGDILDSAAAIENEFPGLESAVTKMRAYGMKLREAYAGTRVLDPSDEKSFAAAMNLPPEYKEYADSSRTPALFGVPQDYCAKVNDLDVKGKKLKDRLGRIYGKSIAVGFSKICMADPGALAWMITQGTYAFGDSKPSPDQVTQALRTLLNMVRSGHTIDDETVIVVDREGDDNIVMGLAKRLFPNVVFVLQLPTLNLFEKSAAKDHGKAVEKARLLEQPLPDLEEFLARYRSVHAYNVGWARQYNMHVIHDPECDNASAIVASHEDMIA